MIKNSRYLQDQYNGIEEDDNIIGSLVLGILIINKITPSTKATITRNEFDMSIRKVSYIIGQYNIDIYLYKIS